MNRKKFDYDEMHGFIEQKRYIEKQKVIIQNLEEKFDEVIFETYEAINMILKNLENKGNGDCVAKIRGVLENEELGFNEKMAVIKGRIFK